MAILKAVLDPRTGYYANYHRVGGVVAINVDKNTVDFNMVGYKDADMRKADPTAVMVSTGLGFVLENPLATYTATDIYALCYAAAKAQEKYVGGVDG